MSEDETMSENDPDRLDAPNQQVVREDESGPADEGDGGAPTEPEPAEPTPEPEPAPTEDDDEAG